MHELKSELAHWARDWQTVSRKGAKHAKGAKKAKTKVLYFLCVLCAFA